MSRRTIVSTTILVCLLAIGGRLVFKRGFGMSLGAAPFPLAAPYTTEEAWIVSEIVRDITEMSAFPAPPSGAPTIQPDPGQSGLYTVALEGARSATLDLRQALWAPQAFAAVARSTFGGANAGPSNSTEIPLVHPSLLAMTPAALIEAANAASAALRTNIRHVAAHDAAAMTLGAFALRESAPRSGDTRWALNRMTAHLAIAQALSASERTVDGRIAEAILLVLTHRQTEAMRVLEALDAGTTNAGLVWTRTLRLRMTDDWRAVAVPQDATRAEQREYFRARRATLRSLHAAEELERLNIPLDLDFIRIINSYAVGVEDGGLLDTALHLEREEYQNVFLQLHGRSIAEGDLQELNALATRGVAGGELQVLPWGAWAEFAQRHIAVVIGRFDSYFRHTLGNGPQADLRKVQLKQQLGDLWMFPLATLWWTKGPNGKEADLRYINESVTEVLTRPYHVTAMEWSFLELGTHYEPVRRGLPPPQSWFLKPATRSAYDVVDRVKNSGHGASDLDLVGLTGQAPHDYELVAKHLTVTYGQKFPFDEVVRRAGGRMQYDPRAVGDALSGLPSDDERRVALLEASCPFSSSLCLSLGSELAGRKRDAAAALAYERAFRDPSLDAVALSNSSAWLVRYYATHDRVPAALDLASRAAETGAFMGQVTAARLFERLGRMIDAESMFRESADGYDNPSELLGFYYRSAEVRREPNYSREWAMTRTSVFPDGLLRDPFSSEKPDSGVYVESDSDAARAIGLHAGDIIVGVDGWHVRNVRQYRAVRAFPDAGKVTLAVWRGTTREVEIADRDFVPEFRIANYPVTGWIER